MGWDGLGWRANGGMARAPEHHGPQASRASRTPSIPQTPGPCGGFQDTSLMPKRSFSLVVIWLKAQDWKTNHYSFIYPFHSMFTYVLDARCGWIVAHEWPQRQMPAPEASRSRSRSRRQPEDGERDARDRRQEKRQGEAQQYFIVARCLAKAVAMGTLATRETEASASAATTAAATIAAPVAPAAIVLSQSIGSLGSSSLGATSKAHSSASLGAASSASQYQGGGPHARMSTTLYERILSSSRADRDRFYF